jgi:hypothetical protein
MSPRSLGRVRCPVVFRCSHPGCIRQMPGTYDFGVNEDTTAVAGFCAIAEGWKAVEDPEDPGRFVLFCPHHGWRATALDGAAG